MSRGTLEHRTVCPACCGAGTRPAPGRLVAALLNIAYGYASAARSSCARLVTGSCASRRHGKPSGALAVVGLGPGAPDQLTPAARAAIAGAEVVIGYRAYLELVAPLLAGKELVAGRMTGETERARDAIARARAGARVALVSSGDPGV